MIRLAVPIVILLLSLFAGAVWALHTYLTGPQTAGAPPPETQLSTAKDEAPSAAATEKAAEAAKAKATFDVARIDPHGTSVFAGRAEPNSSVTIMADGKAVGTAQADDNGEWTFATEHEFASADPKLALLPNAPSQAPSPPSAQTKVATAADASKVNPNRKSASAVTSHLLKNLEGMVEAARTTQEPEVAAKTPTPLPAPADDAAPNDVAVVAPAPSVPEPRPEAPVTHKSVPVPITFIYNEANFTGDGKKAAALLLEYLQLKHFPKISLTGHADERGTDEFNMELSRERLDTVAHYLKENGYKGRLELIPKGETEPFTGVVRSEYPPEELFQLDRRVELVITQ